MPSLFRLIVLTLASPLFLAPVFAAQSGCTPPPFSPSSGAENLFTPQQEADLGDAVAEHLGGSLRVIEEEVLTTRLLLIGDRLVRHLPPLGYRVRFFLIDLPTANAFAIPGGRIYVSRKLIALTRNEDELAGVLGHELGHLLARQTSLELSRAFRRLLNVSSVSDRKDVFDKYHQFLENIMRKPGALRSGHSEDKEQIDADTVGVYAVALSGYNPQAAVDFWDRLADTKGKTGSWLSNFFGTIQPENKRLREMTQAISRLPASCKEVIAVVPVAEYQTWQTLVANYNGLGRKESLPALVNRLPLNPPLGNQLSHLRFSPDGKFVLAQDDSSIYILSREPFASLFRIPAPEAAAASFTPDSKEVVFNTPDLRVERWNVEEERLETVHEIHRRGGCLQSLLSPDGKTLACLYEDQEQRVVVVYPFHLALIDTATGAVVFEKKDFIKLDYWPLFRLMLYRIFDIPLEYAKMTFSPDSRYYVAARDDFSLAVDLPEKSAVSLSGSVKKLLKVGFAFMGADRLVGVNASDQKKSGIVRFPSGEILDTFDIGHQSLIAPTRGEFVILRPIQDYAVGVYSLSEKKILMANKNPAFDVFDTLTLSERRNGELGLYDGNSNKPIALLQIPRGPLGRLRTVAISPSLDWLAVSEVNRGAVWNLKTGERVFHIRGFRGAYFSPDGALYADFPKFQDTERFIGRLNLSTRETQQFKSLGESRVLQRSRYLIVENSKKDGDSSDRGKTLEVQDVQTGNVLWSRVCPREGPRVIVDPQQDRIVLFWPLSSAAAKDELKASPELADRLRSMKEKEGDYFVRIVESQTGKSLGAVLIETGKGSFRIDDAFAVGDTLIVSDTENRVLTYSISSGEQKGRLFGRRAWASEPAGLIAVETEVGRLAIYDLKSLDKKESIIFGNRISATHFSADGSRLLVLTAGQVAYTFDLRALGSSTAQTTAR